MNCFKWIVCERTRWWAPALRTALARDSFAAAPCDSVSEVRTLEELAERLAVTPHCIAMIAVNRASAGRTLEWLAGASAEFRSARFVMMLDAELTTPVPRSGGPLPRDFQMFRHALVEAGAAAIVDSARHLPGILELGRRLASVRARAQRAEETDLKPLEDFIQSSLPWQDG